MPFLKIFAFDRPLIIMKNIIRNTLVTILVTAGMLNFAFSQTDIVKYKDKINSNKEYEIEGQDILDVINTIDSLESVVDSLFWTLQDVKAERDGNATALENFLNNSKNPTSTLSGIIKLPPKDKTIIFFILSPLNFKEIILFKYYL